MPLVPSVNEAASPGTQVAYLLISPPNSVTARRLRLQMAAAGIDTAESDIGLEISCGPFDYRLILESIGLNLSPAERRDTRIALAHHLDDRAAVQRSIFRAQSLDLLLTHSSDRWFDHVLERSGIAVFFQPMVQYPPGRLHGYECLMRGIDIDGTLIAPNRMFDAARRLGKLAELDEKCRSAAISAAAHLNAGNINFFINVIPSVIRQPKRFLVSTLQELQAGGLRPDQITFEIVETDRIQDQRQFLDLLSYYRKAGFKVALDDVGAGYSSLLSLSKLRPDYIKLDGELVRRAAQSALEAKIVADLAETARQNGIITVAEGIETPEQLRLALDCGIRITQGYFHAKPQPGALSKSEIDDMLARVVQVARHQKASHCI